MTKKMFMAFESLSRYAMRRNHSNIGTSNTQKIFSMNYKRNRIKKKWIRCATQFYSTFLISRPLFLWFSIFFDFFFQLITRLFSRKFFNIILSSLSTGFSNTVRFGWCSNCSGKIAFHTSILQCIYEYMWF